MRIVIVLLGLLFPMLGKGQAHLGESFSGLKARYPDKLFKLEYTDHGSAYTAAEQPLGTFIYFFDADTHLTYMCIQIPDNLEALNAQVEIYNRKYVIISDKSWKAYLEGGEPMSIDLTYDEEYSTYIFYYTL